MVLAINALRYCMKSLPLFGLLIITKLDDNKENKSNTEKFLQTKNAKDASIPLLCISCTFYDNVATTKLLLVHNIQCNQNFIRDFL